MNAKDIAARKFDKAINGYKPYDVDEFLKEISAEFSQLQKDNRDLEKKLGVLADKVREYRNDEDALKEALLGAQKQGHAAIAEAKEKSKKIIEDAQNKADTTLADSRASSEKMKSEAEETLRKAGEESKRILDEANNNREKMEEEYKAKLNVNKEILHKTKNEVTRFRQKLLEDFSRVTGIIESLPESCENDFITKTLNEYQKERNVTLKKPVSKPSVQPEAKKPAEPEPVKKTVLSNVNLDKPEDSDALYEEFAAQMIEDTKSTSFEVKMEEKFISDLTTEIHFEPVFEEESGEQAEASATDEFSVPEADAESENEDGTEIKERDNLFFKKGQNPVKSREALEFGANSKSGRRNK